MKKEKTYKLGRIISSILLVGTIITLFIFGGYYILYSKEKSNAIIIGVLFGLPAFMTMGFVYVVSQKKEDIKEFITMVGDKGNELAKIVYKKDGTVEAYNRNAVSVQTNISQQTATSTTQMTGGTVPPRTTPY